MLPLYGFGLKSVLVVSNAGEKKGTVQGKSLSHGSDD